MNTDRMKIVLAFLVVFTIVLFGKYQKGIFPKPAGVVVVGGSSSSSSRCDRVFSMSDTRLYWERHTNYTPPSCSASGLAGGHAGDCLVRLTASRGRRAHIVFIGDSRARVIFEKLQADLQLRTWRGKPLKEMFPDVPNATRKLTGIAPLCLEGHRLVDGVTGQLRKLACSLIVEDTNLRLDFYWRHLVTPDFTSKLAELAMACERGAADCPDIVALHVGMWYAKPFAYVRELALQERVLKMRLDAQELGRHVRRLTATGTKVVYRLDGPEMRESHGDKSRVGGVLLAINALGAQAIKQAGGAQLWTSSLADSLQFYHNVCLRLAARHALNAQPVRHECLDENHVGETVRTAAYDALLSYVCDTAHERRPGHCCGVWT